LITTRIEEGAGIVWLDAVEYLGSRHGFDALMNFVQSVGDSVASSEWSLILPYNPLAFESTQVARLRREAGTINLSESASTTSQVKETSPSPPTDSTQPSSSSREQSQVEELDVEVEGDDEAGPSDSNEVHETVAIEVEPGLLMLSRIPLVSLSRAVLQRRLEQWDSMGFDIGELEPVLLVDDRQSRYDRYRVYEEKVRRAVECERRIRELESLGFNTDATKLRFRTMQLTNLDDIELRLERLLAEAR
jgi:hypothetical protein